MSHLTDLTALPILRESLGECRDEAELALYLRAFYGLERVPTLDDLRRSASLPEDPREAIRALLGE